MVNGSVWAAAAPRSVPISQLDQRYGRELLSQRWNAAGDDLPDRVIFQTEVGMSQYIPQPSNAPPGDRGMTQSYVVWYLFGSFSEELQVPQHCVNGQFVCQ